MLNLSARFLDTFEVSLWFDSLLHSMMITSEKSIRRKENGHAIKIKRFCANMATTMRKNGVCPVTFHDDINYVSTPSINWQHSFFELSAVQ